MLSLKDDELMQPWAKLYLKKSLTPLQKRLYDWWNSEGFFYASRFQDNSERTEAELMLLLGDGADSLLASNDLSKATAKAKIEEKRSMGWEMIEFDSSHYVLRDTENNRIMVERLLEENIRHFSLSRFTTKEMNGEVVLKSVVIEIKRRAGAL